MRVHRLRLGVHRCHERRADAFKVLWVAAGDEETRRRAVGRRLRRLEVRCGRGAEGGAALGLGATIVALVAADLRHRRLYRRVEPIGPRR